MQRGGSKKHSPEICIALDVRGESVASLNCLLYDFIGTTSNEDTSDDLSTVQIPSTWRTIIMDLTNIELFFNLYFHLPSEMAANALSCLVQLSAVRRSFFNNTERMK